ncbi:hypothetical protein NVT85_11900 [Acinetobacter radioresistens]|uniref:DNA translocase FtsK n=1 Tax=Acinetobacter radioresistens TaxID=40216 RepID=UPI002245CB5E|nr:DNA translocase FtsK [Acinetobacter radioresistens]MCX0337455.1 hypothetical protein [Acinetobacter radioresistens]
MDISEEDYQKAIAVVRKCLSGSVSNLQRKLYWGYGRAASAIDRMQDEFIVSPMSASGRRDVYPEETHELWKELQAAKAQAVPEGYQLVKKPRPLVGNNNVDFSQAPEWAKFWLKDGYSKRCLWTNKRPKIDVDIGCFVFPYNYQALEAPDFGFDGDWSKSLTSRKAMIEAQEQKG